MKTGPNYILDEYVFFDKSNWFDRVFYVLLNSVYKFSKMSALAPPIRYRESLKNLKPPNLVELGKAVGIKDADQLITLSFQEKRDVQYRFFAGLTALIIFFSLGVPLLYIFGDFGRFTLLFDLPTGFSSIISMILIFGIFSAVILYGFRIATFIIDKYYADTLCLVSSIFLLIELSRENALIQPNMVRSLLFRLRVLARNILLLVYYYESPSVKNNAWIRDFFMKMEMRVREYERWVIAPDKNTLRNLRSEINKLTKLFLDRNYEKVSYELPEVTIASPQDQRNKLPAFINRIIGIAVPGLFLGLLYFYPDQIDNIGLDRNIVGLISISWLLLTVDASLGLGITDRVSNFAKAIRDLK